MVFRIYFLHFGGVLVRIREIFSAWKLAKQRLKAKNKLAYAVVDLVEMLVVALICALLIRKFIVQTSVIPSESMVSTLQVRDRLFVNKLTFRFREPKRGDIVVFKSVEPGDDKEIVKRCVALPLETVVVERGVVYVDGKVVSFPGVVIHRDYDFFGPYTVPEGHYFMMGDNRAYSKDSRYWGTVPRTHVLGTAWVVFWPFSRMQVLH
jgi:signal peptidase I